MQENVSPAAQTLGYPRNRRPGNAFAPSLAIGRFSVGDYDVL